MACHRQQREDRRGAAAAELAMVLPFLALLFATALDFCRIFHTSQAIQASAHAGALYASGVVSDGDPDNSESAVKQAAVVASSSLRPAISGDKVTLTVEGSMAVVTVEYEYQLLTPFLERSGVVTIRRTVKMGYVPKGP